MKLWILESISALRFSRDGTANQRGKDAQRNRSTTPNRLWRRSTEAKRHRACVSGPKTNRKILNDVRTINAIKNFIANRIINIGYHFTFMYLVTPQ